MIKCVFLTFLLAFTLLIPCGALNLQEFGFIGGVNNVSFEPDLFEFNNGEKFESYNFIYGDINLKLGVNDNTGLNFNLSRDTILWNSFYTGLKLNTEFVNMEFGPLIGYTDDFEDPVLGFSGEFEFFIPGIFFFSIGGSSSFGTQSSSISNDIRESAKAKIGFWLPYVLPAFSVEYKFYTRFTQNEAEELIQSSDEFTRFMISADIFAKNFPAVFVLNAGYDILKRSTLNHDSFNSYYTEINSVFAGAEVRWQVSHPLRLTAGFEIPYILDIKPTEKPDVILFKLYAGFSWRFF